jgi:hypothetical protein
VNRFVSGKTYAKFRLISGTLFILLGAVLIFRTATTVRFSATSIVPLIAGAAMIGLGVVRWREYLRMRDAAQ